MRFLLIAIFVFGSSVAYAFNNKYNKHDSDTKITSFVLMGERCTGTKFLGELILNNLNAKHIHPFHKHFMPWLNVSEKMKISKFQLTRSETNSYFKNTEDCLFIFLVRDPYDWVRSFFKHPYHVSGHLTKNFHTFISTTWECYWHQSFPEPTGIDNYNPWKKKPFNNVLELRKYKNFNYLQLSALVKNYLLVRYEDVRNDQEGFIEFISSFYGIKKNTSFRPILDYVGFKKEDSVPFEKSKYFTPSLKEVFDLNRSIDWDQESDLGYFIKSHQEILADNNE